MDNQPQPEPAEDASTPTTWDAQGRYWLLGGAALVAGTLLLFELRNGFAWEVALFSTIALLGGAWALWMATTSVELTPNAIRLRRLVGSQEIAFPQLISVSAQGRFFNILTVLYHPRRADGIIDTDAVRSLLAPAVKNQDELLALLETRVPN